MRCRSRKSQLLYRIKSFYLETNIICWSLPFAMSWFLATPRRVERARTTCPTVLRQRRHLIAVVIFSLHFYLIAHEFHSSRQMSTPEKKENDSELKSIVFSKYFWKSARNWSLKGNFQSTSHRRVIKSSFQSLIIKETA